MIRINVQLNLSLNDGPLDIFLLNIDILLLLPGFQRKKPPKSARNDDGGEHVSVSVHPPPSPLQPPNNSCIYPHGGEVIDALIILYDT